MTKIPINTRALAEAEASTQALPAEPAGEEGRFAGYASTFGPPADTFGDIVAPGAFAQSLEAHRAAGTMPAMLWSHDQAQPIGRWLDLREDETGLWVQGALTLGVAKAAEARALLLDGALGLSVGFLPRRTRALPGGGREIAQADLVEISLTPLPANSRARVVSAKSAAPEFGTPRDLERWLRDMGLTKAQARAVTAKGWAGLDRKSAAQGRRLEAIRALRAHLEQ